MGNSRRNIKTAGFIFLMLIFNLLLVSEMAAQPAGGGWAKNVSLLKKGFPERSGESSDVWGWRDSQTGKDYALVTINGNLSIVETTDPANPHEVAYIVGTTDGIDERSLGVPDVEVYESGGNAYAYLARNVLETPYTVLIINLRQAVTQTGVFKININSWSGSILTGLIPAIPDTIRRCHTLTIAGGILYICPAVAVPHLQTSGKSYFDVWDLRVRPANPSPSLDHIGKYQAVYSTTTAAERRGVHEMFVKSTGANTARVYAAALTDGLQVFDLSYSNAGGQWAISTTSSVVQQYDFDRQYPTVINSTDSNFDRRLTHSAWPTDDEQYVFTTDELAAPNLQANDDDSYPPKGDGNDLTTNTRKGNFLRIWKRSELNTSTALKAGYDVPEGNETGVTSLSSVAVSPVPNSVHQLFIRGTKAYVANYTQGFRVLNISNPLSPSEDGYYDDYATMDSGDGDNSYYRLHWFDGIYGVYPDPNRPNIVYAGNFGAGATGLYIFSVRDFSGTISVNTIWEGAITISANTTVAAGVTLTIKPGANITAAPNACLIVDGALAVEGTSSQPVVMNRSGSSGVWGGIVFNSGSSGTVSYATIRNVSKGIRVTSTAPTIQNSTIESFTEQGIYAINSNAKIYTNTINGWSGSARVGTGIYVNNSGLGSSTLEITGNTVKGAIVGIDATAPVSKLEQNTLGTPGTYTAASSNAYGIVFAGVGTVTNNKTYGDNTNSWGISLAANSGAKSTTYNLLDHHNIGLVDNGFQNGSISRNTFSNNGTGFNNSDGWMTANENNFWDSPSTTYNIANVSTSCPDHTNNYLESWSSSSDPKYYNPYCGNDPWYPPAGSPFTAGPTWKAVQDEEKQKLPALALSGETPATFSLSSYPNPFNPSTTLSYEVPENAIVSLVLYDMLGREVRTFEDGYRTAGRYSAVWDGTNTSGSLVSTGLYLLRLQAGNTMLTHKLLLTK